TCTSCRPYVRLRSLHSISRRRPSSWSGRRRRRRSGSTKAASPAARVRRNSRRTAIDRRLPRRSIGGCRGLANGGRRDVANNAQTIIDLDRKRMQAMGEKDLATLDALLADDLIYTHSSARVDTKQTLIANMTSGATVYSSIEPSDVKAQDLGDTVVLTRVAWVKVVSRGNQLDFGVRFTDAYTRRNGRWQMVVWQSTRLPTD